MIRESARMAYDFIKANASRIGLDRDIAEYDVNVQSHEPMQGKDSADLGVAMFIAIDLRTRGPIHRRLVLVVLGQMSIHGVLNRVEGLGGQAADLPGCRERNGCSFRPRAAGTSRSCRRS